MQHYIMYGTVWKSENIVNILKDRLNSEQNEVAPQLGTTKIQKPNLHIK